MLRRHQRGLKLVTIAVLSAAVAWFFSDVWDGWLMAVLLACVVIAVRAYTTVFWTNDER